MNKKKTNKKGGIWLIIILILVAIVTAIILTNVLAGQPENLSLTQIQDLQNQGAIQQVTLQTNGVHAILRGYYEIGGKVHEFVFKGLTYAEYNALRLDNSS
jgi:uncharacterized protein YpmS